jgi:hypothetical protein
MVRLRRVISGGQTGVDRAALDAALDSGLEVGGWCPKSRLSEEGSIPARYPLRETPSTSYTQRTEWNVRDSEGTLILHVGKIVGGTALTRELALSYGRPHLSVDLRLTGNLQDAVDWLETHRIETLNIAGPRESNHQGIYSRAYSFTIDLIRLAVADSSPLT